MPDIKLRLSKLVKENVLETKNRRFRIKKRSKEKWLSSMEKTHRLEPPKVVSKSKASMKKGSTKKI